MTNHAARYSAIVASMPSATATAHAAHFRVKRAAWEGWLAKRSVHVRERILRFYPDAPPKEGEQIRGYHRRHPDGITLFCAVMSRGAVIRRYGRMVWGAIECIDQAGRRCGKEHISRRGKRAYATLDIVYFAAGLRPLSLDTAERAHP